MYPSLFGLQEYSLTFHGVESNFFFEHWYLWVDFVDSFLELNLLL